MAGARISAVVLDLDGTLLDTERATRGILGEFLAMYGKVPDLEKEEKRLGQMHKESAAEIVRDYELPMSGEEFSEAIMPLYKERWPQAKPLPGVNRLIRHLHKHGIPLGLASNSIRKYIETKLSHHKDWKESFSVILGGDDVNHGKPSPDIFLEAAKRLGADSSSCLVIEDSVVGVRAAKASGAKVVAVPSLQSQVENYSIANSVLHSLLEFQPELWGLPPFEDWVQNTLPIEPLLVRDLFGEVVSDAILSVNTENCSCESLPDQLWGVLFGWAKLEKHGTYKMVASIGWDLSLGIPKRVMRLSLLDPIENFKGELLHLLLVGYIRKLQNEENMSEALKISEEDESIARAALDLPVFAHHANNLLFE
ncbi:bifunctional riboflavin kinase/FMN phosphatase-like [Ananas comosus]|uniref:riboflavin kinase n=2 Tax=Ananas comosus TaxID=4615 RepID=A0A6P5FQZ8_ANACO|nr:bifunctional riboflavin kinase/FMN phosphatase-like [Ananas comosus]